MSVDHSARYGDFTLQAIVTEPPWYENCYIVTHVDSGWQIVVDPGSNAREIMAVLGANGGPVREILLTHAHPDHIGAVPELQQTLGLDCRAHEGELPLLEDAPGFSLAALGIATPRPKSFKTFGDAVELVVGGVKIEVIPCPGHTPGGVVYVFPGFALTGDTLFNHGIGRTDLPGGDGPTLMRSITRLLDRLDPATVLYCGHGPAWVAEEAKEWWSQMGGIRDIL